MTQAGDYAEAVFLFDEGEIVEEMAYAEFEGIISQAAGLERFAASHVRSAYAIIGEGLSVRGVVLFLLKIDESGLADPTFNIPLRHLVRNAGRGPDVGNGRVRYAHRGQCPVPWHAVNLWMPEDEEAPVERVQRSVWRNKLGLKPSTNVKRLQQDELDDVELEPSTPEVFNAVERHKRLEATLDDTFGDEGRVSVTQLIQHHNSQLSKLAQKYREDVAAQQQLYLDQVRSCKDEIHRLRVALRHEQERSRRLQQLLRGEVR